MRPVQPSADAKDATEALVALGANLPSEGRSPARTVTQAAEILAEMTGRSVVTSRLFRTPAFPPGAGPDFVNAAAKFPWNGSAPALLELLHAVEADLGRVRKTRWAARVMDLDLIALGGKVEPDAATQALWADLPADRAAEETPDRLILPHPRLAERAFVLVPLADIAPDWVHPLTGRSVARMLADRPAAERAEIWPLDGGDAPENTGQTPASPLSSATPGDT